MRRLLICLGCTAVLIAAFAPVQHAIAKAGKCVSDPRGDTHKAPKPKADYDFTAACAHTASHHRIIATAKLVGTVQVPKSPQGAVPSLLIDVPGQKFDNPTCDYFVQGSPPGTPGNKT